MNNSISLLRSDVASLADFGADVQAELSDVNQNVDNGGTFMTLPLDAYDNKFEKAFRSGEGVDSIEKIKSILGEDMTMDVTVLYKKNETCKLYSPLLALSVVYLVEFDCRPEEYEHIRPGDSLKVKVTKLKNGIIYTTTNLDAGGVTVKKNERIEVEVADICNEGVRVVYNGFTYVITRKGLFYQENWRKAYGGLIGRKMWVYSQSDLSDGLKVSEINIQVDSSCIDEEADFVHKPGDCIKAEVIKLDQTGLVALCDKKLVRLNSYLIKDSFWENARSLYILGNEYDFVVLKVSADKKQVEVVPDRKFDCALKKIDGMNPGERLVGRVQHVIDNGFYLVSDEYVGWAYVGDVDKLVWEYREELKSSRFKMTAVVKDFNGRKCLDMMPPVMETLTTLREGQQIRMRVVAVRRGAHKNRALLMYAGACAEVMFEKNDIRVDSEVDVVVSIINQSAKYLKVTLCDVIEQVKSAGIVTGAHLPYAVKCDGDIVEFKKHKIRYHKLDQDEKEYETGDRIQNLTVVAMDVSADMMVCCSSKDFVRNGELSDAGYFVEVVKMFSSEWAIGKIEDGYVILKIKYNTMVNLISKKDISGFSLKAYPVHNDQSQFALLQSDGNVINGVDISNVRYGNVLDASVTKKTPSGLRLEIFQLPCWLPFSFADDSVRLKQIGDTLKVSFSAETYSSDALVCQQKSVTDLQWRNQEIAVGDTIDVNVAGVSNNKYVIVTYNDISGKLLSSCPLGYFKSRIGSCLTVTVSDFSVQKHILTVDYELPDEMQENYDGVAEEFAVQEIGQCENPIVAGQKVAAKFISRNAKSMQILLNGKEYKISGKTMHLLLGVKDWTYGSSIRYESGDMLEVIVSSVDEDTGDVTFATDNVPSPFEAGDELVLHYDRTDEQSRLVLVNPFGMECVVSGEEISWLPVTDVNDLLLKGNVVKVKMLNSMEGSLRAANEDVRSELSQGNVFRAEIFKFSKKRLTLSYKGNLFQMDESDFGISNDQKLGYLFYEKKYLDLCVVSADGDFKFAPASMDEKSDQSGLKAYDVSDVVTLKIDTVSDRYLDTIYKGRHYKITVDELDWNPIPYSLKTVYKSGDKISAVLMSDACMSVKYLKDDPWETVDLREGELAEGMVVHYVTQKEIYALYKGVLVRIDRSDAFWMADKKLKDYYEAGNVISGRILSFDKASRICTASLKEGKMSPLENFPFTAGDKLTVAIKELSSDRVVVEYEDFVGNIPNKEMSWDGSHYLNKYSVRQQLEVLYLGVIDSRLTFSLKRAQDAPILKMRPGDVVDFVVGAVQESRLVGKCDGVMASIEADELSWFSFGNFRNVERFKDGSVIKAMIISVDYDEGCVMLSHRRMMQCPFETLKVKDVVEVTVTGEIDRNAYVVQWGDLYGLIKFNDAMYFSRIDNRLVKGETVRAQICAVDASSGEIFLSVRPIVDNPYSSGFIGEQNAHVVEFTDAGILMKYDNGLRTRVPLYKIFHSENDFRRVKALVEKTRMSDIATQVLSVDPLDIRLCFPFPVNKTNAFKPTEGKDVYDVHVVSANEEGCCVLVENRYYGFVSAEETSYKSMAIPFINRKSIVGIDCKARFIDYNEGIPRFSIKDCLKSPQEKYSKGQLVEGLVYSRSKIGYLVELEDSVGFIHSGSVVWDQSDDWKISLEMHQIRKFIYMGYDSEHNNCILSNLHMPVNKNGIAKAVFVSRPDLDDKYVYVDINGFTAAIDKSDPDLIREKRNSLGALSIEYGATCTVRSRRVDYKNRMLYVSYVPAES